MKVVIDGSLLRGREAYHSHLADTLGFPSYYGRNLDALYDLLSVADTTTEIAVRHVPDMRKDLGMYADELLGTLEEAARVNPRLTLRYDDGAGRIRPGREVDDEVIALRDAEAGVDDFIASHENYIRSRVRLWGSRDVLTGAPKLDAGDLWSIALSAFAEAMRDYDETRGAFYAFASLVIDRRLTDHCRYVLRRSREVAIDPALLSGSVAPSDSPQAASVARSVADMLTATADDTLQLEIDAAGQVLSAYGFSFFDLATASPRAGKTRQACAEAVRCLLDSPLILSEMRVSRQLPQKILEKRTGIPRKILERHRKYIIAAAEILDGDFPGLSGYMRHIRGRKRT